MSSSGLVCVPRSRVERFLSSLFLVAGACQILQSKLRIEKLIHAIFHPSQNRGEECLTAAQSIGLIRNTTLFNCHFDVSSDKDMTIA